MTIILESAKLKELDETIERVKHTAKECHATEMRLAKLIFPNWLDSTVVRVTDVEAPSAAYIGIKPRELAATVVTTGAEHESAARISKVISRTIAGEMIATDPTPAEEHEKAQRQRYACEQTLGHLGMQRENELSRLKQEYCISLKPSFDQNMSKLCKTILDVLPAWKDVYAVKRELIDSGVGLRCGLAHTLPDFLGSPNDSYSALASFLTAAAQAGWIKDKDIPASLKAGR